MPSRAGLATLVCRQESAAISTSGSWPSLGDKGQNVCYGSQTVKITGAEPRQDVEKLMPKQE
jgi:hypothetical protein